MTDNQTENELGQQILKISNTIIKHRNRDLLALDLTARQADSLHYFILHECSTVSDLKQYLDITHQTARGIVQRMVTKGLLQLEKSDKDGRYQMVKPTEKGMEVERRIIHNREKTGEILLKKMSEAEKREFVRLLDIAFKNIKDSERGDTK